MDKIDIITNYNTLLSKYNKLGDPDMQEFCRRQPDRIYQFRVEKDGDPAFIACLIGGAIGLALLAFGIAAKLTNR